MCTLNNQLNHYLSVILSLHLRVSCFLNAALRAYTRMVSGTSHRVLVAVAATLAIVPSTTDMVVAQTCSRATTALTSDCGKLCYDGRPCIAYASSFLISNTNLTTCAATPFSKCEFDADGACAYECFTNGPNDFVKSGIVEFSSYTFLIPFGELKSAWETSWNASEQAEYENSEAAEQNETSSLPSKSNNVLQNLEQLDFLKSTKTVYVYVLCSCAAESKAKLTMGCNAA